MAQHAGHTDEQAATSVAFVKIDNKSLQSSKLNLPIDTFQNLPKGDKESQ